MQSISMPNPMIKAVRNLTIQAVGRKQPAMAGLVSEWAEVVGAEWAGRCVPNVWKQARGAEHAALELAVSPGYAPIVAHELPVLEARINSYFGYRALTSLRLKQVERLPNNARKAARADIAPLKVDVSDPELALALGKLGACIRNSGR